jgi:drug/metabolite transporter (DMT)-like permease
LGERLSPQQWIGSLILAISLFLVGFDKIPPQKRISTGWLSWLNPPTLSTNDFPWQSQP